MRFIKHAWVHMAKALSDEGYGDRVRVAVRQAVKKVVWGRNCQLTVSLSSGDSHRTASS